MLIASSSKGDDSHNEPISKVMWYKVPGKKKLYHVLSVGLDGKMLVWKLDKDKNRLKLSKGYVLLAQHMPKSVKIKSSKRNPEMGVTSLDFSCVDEETFYIGSESGGMFRCSVNSQVSAGDSTSSISLVDPVKLTFLPHCGPVYSVNSSPYHRNLFLSCSSDSTLRVHSILQTQPVMVIEPASGYLYTVRWSPTKPLVFAVTTQDGRALIYDLKKSQTTPAHVLEASPSKQAVYVMEFNQKQRKFMATGDAVGVIKVWQLNDEITTESAAERDILNSLADTSGQD
ncbi:WDR34 [Bugula neritina]|uniref:WDR34 n=1 Tax=Bugula neritina TaxID=10212 RepID=A0A7J7JS79_BUGNE|nr:WDR34 [Bugula neritina]